MWETSARLLRGFDFQVHEPPELVEHIRTLAARLARAAAADERDRVGSQERSAAHVRLG